MIMDNKRIIFNVIKGTLHKLESFFSSGTEKVVFTEDSKCFPTSEIVEIDDMDGFKKDVLFCLSRLPKDVKKRMMDL
jgi:hypothetical protein